MNVLQLRQQLRHLRQRDRLRLHRQRHKHLQQWIPISVCVLQNLIYHPIVIVIGHSFVELRDSMRSLGVLQDGTRAHPIVLPRLCLRQHRQLQLLLEERQLQLLLLQLRLP